jgi:hypothetical protein
MTAVVERVTGFALASQANKASAWRSKNCPTAALVMFGDNARRKTPGRGQVEDGICPANRAADAMKQRPEMR